MDYAALHWLLTERDPSGWLMRWRILLVEYDFEVKYKPENINTRMDELSRLRTLSQRTDFSYFEEIPTYEDPVADKKNNAHDDKFGDVLNIDEYEHDVRIGKQSAPDPSSSMLIPLTPRRSSPFRRMTHTANNW